MQAKKIYLSLGSNLGDRSQNLERAIAALERENIRVKTRSSIYETEPRDVTDQPWFLNMVIECEAEYFPLQLLAILQRVERKMGRVRRGMPPRGPRLIDIDILLFGTVKMKTAKLEVPHPRMLERRFVIEPLLEIAADFREAAAALEKVKGQIVRRV